MDMKDISGQIDESVHTLLANQAGNSSLIESALKKILRENMNEINEIQANMPTAAANGAIHLKSMFARRQEEPQSDPGLVALAHEHESHRIGVSIDSDSGLHRTAIRTRTVGVRRYSFWFGTMIMITTTRIRNRRNESSTDIPLAQQTTEIRLVPANFLTSFAMSATITRVAAEYRKPSMFLNLEPLRIVHQHSPIIIAIRCGDLFEVQKLLGAGHAALSDCLLDGQTLLDACFKPMEEMCELRESESNEYPETSHYYVKGFSNEELEKWSRSVRLIGWLVKQGVDPGRTHVGSCGFNEGTFFNVMSALTNMEYFKESRHIVEHDFHEMAELMLRSAKTNPIDCTDKPHCLIHMMNKYVCKNMRLPILDILLSQTDWGFDWTTLRKKDGVFLLEALFTWTPEDWVIQGVWEPRLRPEHIQLLQNRSAILRRMIRAAAEIKDPIPTSTSGTPLHINDSVLAVHAGIREALYVVRPALTREIRLDRSWRVLRRSTITDIGTFLGYDATVLAIKQRGETLTECAWRWKVIDIWKEALSEAGYDTHMLLGLDRNPSKLPEHRSSKAGTTATAGVWGAAPIGPSKIAVYLDFPTTLGSLSIEELSWEVGEDDSQRFFREPGLIRSSCDISQHGEELCVHINEGRPEDEKADLFHLEGTDHEFSRGESNIDAGVFAKILGTAGALLSVIY
ncbi:MAG: hypothetical protein M1830_008471 [Pleopsidium flavum]|nr:MAG: hypothetical protein M1830_008471 [Pleopsidium flavum]